MPKHIRVTKELSIDFIFSLGTFVLMMVVATIMINLNTYFVDDVNIDIFDSVSEMMNSPKAIADFNPEVIDGYYFRFQTYYY
jgi:hypothetical protein